MTPVELSFTSEVAASPAQAWQQVTSFEGISQELLPLLRMTIPQGAERISDADVTLGKPLFSSWLLLFGVVPVGRIRITLIELDPGAGFVEQSPMTGMRLWRHERRIIPAGSGCVIQDRLAFEPLLARGMTAWFVRTLFGHRHAVLRRKLGHSSRQGSDPGQR